MIEVRDLSFSYGDGVALDRVSLSIRKSHIVSIIGPSGCGKTTLLYLLAGLLRKGTGSVTVDGVELAGVRSSTAIVFQDLGLMPWKTVLDNVGLGLVIRGKPRDEVSATTLRILDQLDISGYRDKFPGQLSGGEKQRVAIGRALAIEPDLLLMDEPSSALDALTRERLQDLLLSIYRVRPVTMVLVTHSIEEAVFLGQDIVVMGKSRVDHVLQNPHWGKERSREQLDFYKECLLVRELMGERHE